MLILNYKTAPYWLELVGGLRVQVRPFSATVYNMAKDAMEAKNLTDASARLQFSHLTIEVAKIACIGWDGIVDGDGAAVDCLQDRIEWVFDILAIHDDFSTKYLVPGLLMAVEKKDFAPARNGISVGAQDIAADVSTPTGTAARNAPIQ